MKRGATVRHLFKKEIRMAAHLRATNPAGYAQFIRDMVENGPLTDDWHNEILDAIDPAKDYAMRLTTARRVMAKHKWPIETVARLYGVKADDIESDT